MSTFRKQLRECVKTTNHTSFICFVKLITGKKFTKTYIKSIYHLIDREDREGTSRDEVMDWLYKKSND